MPIEQCANVLMCQLVRHVRMVIGILANCLISKLFTALGMRNDLHSSVQYQYLLPHSAKDLRQYGTEY